MLWKILPKSASSSDEQRGGPRFRWTSFQLVLHGFGGVVDGHDATHEFVETGILEAESLHQVSGAALAWIELERLGYVAISVGVAVQNEAEPRSDDRKVSEVKPAIQSQWGMAEIEGIDSAARFERPGDLFETRLEVGNIPESIAASH